MLGERLCCKQKAVSSILTTSTNFQIGSAVPVHAVILLFMGCNDQAAKQPRNNSFSSLIIL